MSGQQSAESDAADYGYADLPSKGGMKIIPNIPPEMTTCRTCGRAATEHTAGRFSIYGTCPIPPAADQEPPMGENQPSSAENDLRRDDLIRRLRGLRANYVVRAEHAPNPPLSWGDAVEDLDDVLAALDGLAWTERRGLTRPIPPGENR